MVTLLDMGLATTFTLYFLRGISFFLFSVAFVSFFHRVLGWQAEIDWIGVGVLVPTFSITQDKFSFS